MKKWMIILASLMVVAGSCKKEDNHVPLAAAIEGDMFEVLAGDSITFHDISQGQAARWKWTFEGGSPESSELSSPTVTYIHAGKYRVVLEISNASESSSVTKEGFVTVGYNQINADFSADRQVVRQGESVSFTDLTTGIPESWHWEFIHETQGVLYTSTEQNPTIQFDEPGSYSVKLTASNPEYEGEKTATAFLEVIDITYVAADFSAAATATYTGGSIAFEDVSLGNVENRTWTFDGGSPASSEEANPVVSYAAPGRYRVKLVVSNAARTSEKELDGYILVVPGDQLAAFLPFNGEAKDAGPLEMGVSVVGNPGFGQSDRNNVEGNVIQFDGASGLLLQSQGILNLGTSDFTVTGWVKASSTARMMVWQESGKNGSGDNQSWLRMGDNSTDRQLRFNTEESGGSSILNIGVEGKLSNDQWNHFACVRSGTNMSVYVNGVKVKEMTTPAVRNVTGNQDFKIGFQEGASSFSNFYTGLIDDLLIYKKALTATEIVSLYQL